MREDWQTVKLESVSVVSAGNSAPQDQSLFKGGEHCFIRTSDVGKIKTGFVGDSQDKLNDQGIKKLRLFPKETILFPKSGASTWLNHRVIMTIDGYVSSHLATISPDKSLTAKNFLFYYLQLVRAQDLTPDNNYPSLRLSDIKGISIPLPPLPEQERIVAILDKAFEGIDKAIAHTEQNLASARELFESYLNNIFTQRGDGWVEKKFGDVCSKIGSGATPRGGADSYKTEGISLIRSLNVYDWRFTENKLAYIGDEQAAKLNNVIIEPSDVLFNITGASIARCCVVPDELLPARVNQHVSILRPDQSELLPWFLCYMLTSRPYKEMLLGIGDEGGSTRQAITKKQLQDLVICFPDLPTQHKVVASILEVYNKGKQLEALYTQKLESLKELKQALLQQAFAGKLTKEAAA
jgi:type I restriction enzyme S subunit